MSESETHYIMKQVAIKLSVFVFTYYGGHAQAFRILGPVLVSSSWPRAVMLHMKELGTSCSKIKSVVEVNVVIN
jgi:hypothetical protein